MDEYGQKWLDWTPTEYVSGKRYYMNRDSGMEMKGTKNYKLGPTGKDFPKTISEELKRNTLDELKKQLELYEVVFPEILSKNQDRVNTILEKI